MASTCSDRIFCRDHVCDLHLQCALTHRRVLQGGCQYPNVPATHDYGTTATGNHQTKVAKHNSAKEAAAKVEDVPVTAPEKEDKKAKDWGRASNDPRNKS